MIRQNLRDAGEDNKNLLLGFQFGGVPSVNSLRSVYGFQVMFNRWLEESVTCWLVLGQALDIQPSAGDTTKNRERKFSVD